MPIYEYQCRACDRDFEHFAKSIQSTEPVVCPHCNSKKVEKRLSVFAAHGGGGGSGSAGFTPCDHCKETGSCAMRPDLV